MKKFLSIALCAVMVLGILAGCGQKGNDTPENNDNNTALSGTVSTNGSTSMDKVIGALKEQFTADNPGVTVTYDPTGSGAGIEAVKNGSTDIGLASRALKDEEKNAGLKETTVALDVYATEGGETALAFSIAAILMVLTLLINLSASLVGRKLRKK